MKGILNLLVILIILGVISSLANRFIPMHRILRFVFNLFITIVSFLYVFQFFGLITAPMLPHIAFF